MENVLETPLPPINLREFLNEYISLLNSTSNDNAQEVPFYFQLDPPVSSDVKDSCSLELLKAPDDNQIYEFKPGPGMQRHTKNNPQLTGNVPKTFTSIMEFKAHSRGNPFTRSQYSYRLVTEPKCNPTVETMGSTHEFDLEITVRFYRPPRAAHRHYKLEKSVFAEEFKCLGSNYLTEMRDKISCICKGKRFVDISNEPDAPLPVLDTDPGYFFISGTFYNDTRNPNNCDYSKTVLDWARTAQGLQDEALKVATMETTRFLDLTVQLGAPLQYLHHGNCEHLFVFSQVELVRPLSRKSYPVLRAVNSLNRRSCYICGVSGFHYIVEQSRRQLHDPAYMCRTCFLSYNYVDGKKVGSFKAYRIYDHSEPEPEIEIVEQPVENLEISSSEDSD